MSQKIGILRGFKFSEKICILISLSKCVCGREKHWFEREDHLYLKSTQHEYDT
jgi:hypothetical protein